MTYTRETNFRRNTRSKIDKLFASILTYPLVALKTERRLTFCNFSATVSLFMLTERIESTVEILIHTAEELSIFFKTHFKVPGGGTLLPK